MSATAGGPAPPATDGLMVVDKAPGWTSHDVVARSRRIFGQRRVGHAGTLDPDATGLLLVGLGRVTRLLRFLTALPKTYTAEIVLGSTTSTLDASGEQTGHWDMSAVTVADARTAARSFVGRIEQVPPMVSAVKVGGQRLHRLARQGIEVDRPARPVTVHRFDVAPGPAPGTLSVEVECSAGTYVRSLAADLGTALGGGAHLRRLRRTRVGTFAEADAHPIEDLGAPCVLTPAEAMRHLTPLRVGTDAVLAVARGRALDGPVTGGGPWAVLGPDGELLGVYEAGDGSRLRPVVVVAAH